MVMILSHIFLRIARVNENHANQTDGAELKFKEWHRE